ncbi:MAG: hypothetical protein WD275_07290 [Rhodothermales bacterium]
MPLGQTVRIAGINILVVSVLLAALEVFVRLAYPEIRPLGTDSRLLADSAFANIPGPRPGAAGRANGVLFRVDSLGFWAYGQRSDSARTSWLLLGDSATMGIGVLPDLTFAGIMADQLQSMRILNPSVIGYASDDYLKVLSVILTSSKYQDLQIRRVTVIWCLNDIYGGVEAAADPDFAVRPFFGPLLTFVQRNVFSYQWLKAVLFDRPYRYFEHDSRLYTDENVGVAASHLKGIADLCSRHSLECDVVMLPYEYQLRSGADENAFAPQTALTQRLERISVPVLDPSRYLAEMSQSPSELFLFGDGIHFSEEGHRLLADYLIAMQRRN